MEPEGPFGEMPGYMGAKMMNLYFNVSCISPNHAPLMATDATSSDIAHLGTVPADFCVVSSLLTLA